jgi:molybdopterin-guanine dinucleotide biosynthesis protein A
LQPVFLLVSRRLQQSLGDFLARGERKIDLWLEEVSHQRVDFSDHPDMFLNVNTPEELEEMEARVMGDSR